MGKCDNCRLRKESAKAFDIHWMGADDCPYNKCPVPDFPKTNADRIRAMTDEELAEFFTQGYYDGPKFYCPVQPVIGEGECAMRSDCRQRWLDWLKQEVNYND